MQGERQELIGKLNALAQEQRQLVDERDDVQTVYTPSASACRWSRRRLQAS
jgi:hypothetical protein